METLNASPTFIQHATELEQLYTASPLVRTVNFHNTSKTRAGQYDRELAYYSKFFSSVNEDDLDTYMTTGHWRKTKPGLIVAVYEGYRNGYDVLAPLLEKHGFIGWFFIITGFVEAPIEQQKSFAEEHRIWMRTSEYPDGRYALTWEELRALDRKHVIASHTRSHRRLVTLDPATLEREIVGSQEDFEMHLGHPVRAFASLKGVACGECPCTDRLIAEAGYDFVFSSFRIQWVGANSSYDRSNRVP